MNIEEQIASLRTPCNEENCAICERQNKYADTLTKLNAVYVAAREIVRDDKFESFSSDENQALQAAIAEVEKE